MTISHLVRPRAGIPPKTSPGRVVHAARARKLRRRGDTINLVRYTITGKPVYEWWPAQKRSARERMLLDMLGDIERHAPGPART